MQTVSGNKKRGARKGAPIIGEANYYLMPAASSSMSVVSDFGRSIG